MSKENICKKSEPSLSVYLWATLGGVATILFFGVLVFTAYYYSYKGPAMEDIVQERKEKLSEVKAKQKQLVSSYEWINEKDGIIRIPVKEAMELTVEKLKQGSVE